MTIKISHWPIQERNWIAIPNVLLKGDETLNYTFTWIFAFCAIFAIPFINIR